MSDNGKTTKTFIVVVNIAAGTTEEQAALAEDMKEALLNAEANSDSPDTNVVSVDEMLMG